MTRRATWLALLGLLAPTTALAGFAAQGPTPPPTEGEVATPLLLWSGPYNSKGTFAADLLLDAADAPLLRWAEAPGEPGVIEGEPLLDDVITARLGARYAISDRVSVGLTLPVVLSHKLFLGGNGASPNLGDAELSAPIALFRSSAGQNRSAIAVVPTLRLPTGAQNQYLGDDGPGGSLVVSASAASGRFDATINLGADVRLFEGEANVQPGPGLIGGGAVGASVSDGFALHLEGRFHQRLAGLPLDDPPEGYAAAAGGSELFVTGRGKLSESAWISGGVGAGLAPGFAAARGRLFLGAGARFGRRSTVARVKPPKEKKPPPEQATEPLPVTVLVQDEAGVPLDATVSVSDSVVVTATRGRALLNLAPGEWVVEAATPGFGAQSRSLSLDQAQRSGETVRFILLPEEGDGVVNVTVTSPEGEAVSQASLTLDGRPVGSSASGGAVVVRGLSDAPVTLETQAEAFRDRSVAEVQPTVDGTEVDLLLARQRGAVQLRVVDGNGRPITGVRTRFSGPDRLGPYSLGDLGKRTFVLRPGSWQVLVSHPDYGIQQRAVELPDRDTELTQVELVLQPPEQGSADLVLRVVDPDNRPVPGARVSLDGLGFGATASGGELRLQDLSLGPRTVAVQGDEIEDRTLEVTLHDGLQEHLAVVGWTAGATLLRARGPEGMAQDAAARFDGPAPVDKTPLGPDGVELIRLGAGVWQVLMSSPSLGFAQQGIRVPDQPSGLNVVDVLLGTVDERRNTLVVEVVDPAGEPVMGADVVVDDLAQGTTASLGTLAIPNLNRGQRVVDVSATPFSQARRAVSVTAAEQTERLALDWGVGAVRVRARTADGPVEDAVVRVGGPRFVPAAPVDDEGQRLIGLEPGHWQFLVSSPEHGLKQVDLTVPDRAQLTEVTVELGPAPDDVAQTIVRVQAPDGSPIPDAMVQVDESEPVPASGGYAALTDVSPGAHRLEITAPDFEPVVVDNVDLIEGTNERIVPMPWVPRPLAIRVRGPSGPTPATLVLEGPVQMPATRTDDQGRADLELAPGAWEVMAFADGLGVQRRSVLLSEKSDVRDADFALAPARVLVEGNRVRVQDQIYFPTGKATLDRSSTALLDEVANTLRAHPELVRIEIGGHTDPSGSTAVNMRLSRDRAGAVAQALIDRGVAPERLVARGYGPTRPQASNDTAEGKAKNRRVEFVSETGE